MARRTIPGTAPRLVVAGAGVFGLACAVDLARRGAAVVVCDPAALGDNASGVAAGMLAPAFDALLDPLSHDHFGLLCAARDLWPAYARGLGLPLEQEGALWAGHAAADVEGRLRLLGAQAAAVSAAEAMASVQGLRVREGAVFTPEDWRVDVANGLLALRAAAQARGVRFISAAVMDFRAGRVRLDDGQSLAVDRLVVAIGAAGADLAPELGKLSPVKGHILRMGGGPRSGPLVRGDGIYVRPHPLGAIVGATMEPGRNDRGIDAQVAAALAARATKLFPEVASAGYQVSVGVRATTADGLPLVGPSIAPAVLLATGARRNGWLLAPAVGAAIGAMAFDEEPGDFAATLAPMRA